jgi:membrane-associated phospholipid phosphatase
VYLRFGKFPELTLGAVALVPIPVIWLITRSREFVRSSILLITILLTYEALQGLTGTLVGTGGIISLAGLDTALVGFNFTGALQTAFLSPTTTMLATFFYGLHVFLVIIAIILFWFKDTRVYRGYAYSMILTSYLALLTFIIMPSAPPWYVGTAQNLLTTGNSMFPSAFRSVQAALLSGESDIFAAFPSLHAAYATLFSVFMFRLGKKYGLASLPILVGVYFSIIYLGQHFLVDLLAGIAYTLFSVFVVERFVMRRQRIRILPSLGPAGAS